MEQILLLQSFGTRLGVKDGLFDVLVPDLSGGGHERREQFAAHTVATVLLHRHTSVSTDALMLAEKHGVQVFVLDESGMPLVFLAGLHTPPAIECWKRQLQLQHSAEGLGFAREWLCQKMRRKIQWLARLRSYRDGEAVEWIAACESALKDQLSRMTALVVLNVGEAAASLRGLEGTAQRLYLDLLARLLPRHLQFQGRSRQPASDIFNSFLNYGYGILYKKVELALWSAGLNPYIGFLHGDAKRQKALLFDFIEPYRPWVDKVVFQLCSRKEVGWQHVRQVAQGLWLNDAGKSLLAGTLFETFGEARETPDGRKANRWQYIEHEAREFARRLFPGERTVAAA